MKIDLTQKIMRIDDKTFTNPETNVDYTLKDVVIEAVLAPKEKEDNKKKYEKYELYLKLKAVTKFVELTTDEISEIKKLIGEVKSALVMGQAWDLLEGGTK